MAVLGTNTSFNGLNSNYLNGLTNDINKTYNQQKVSQLAQIKAEQQAAVSKLNTQKKETQTSFQGQRNSADVIAAQNTQKLRELMAANGLQASGENVTATAQNNTARQSSINALNLQQQSAVRDINNQINDVNNPAKQQAVIAQIEADRSKALLDARNTAQNQAWNQYTYNQDAAWRQYAYNNMSAAEKAQLNWTKQQYGEDAAWRMYELQYNGNVQLSTNQAQIGAYTNALAGIP